MSMDPTDEVALQALGMIGTYGVQVTYVGAGDGKSPFAYTAGLTEIGEPELMLVLAAPPSILHPILNDIAKRVLDGQRLQPGDRLSDVLEGPYDVVICGPVPDDAMHADASGYFPGVARSIYGDRVRVFQVVVPDGAGRFPWQDGYAIASQPLLGPPPRDEEDEPA
jgi:hypothetical protein